MIRQDIGPDRHFNGQSLWRETYTLDAEGDRTRRNDTALGVIPATSTSYGYDGLLRLTNLDRTLSATGTPLSSETFSLDAATNIASRTGPSAAYSYDGANRLTSDGVRSFTFDGADRLTGRGSDTFGYDALSRLTSSIITSASPGASASALYAYDGDGLLRSRTSSGVTTAYLWDTSVGIAQLLVAGSERLVYGLGPLCRVHADGSYDAFIRDALGSVRAEVSGSGTLSNAFDYTAYGELRASLAGPPTLLGFAGELRDPSGPIYLRARWYDPGVGRFLRADPRPGVMTTPPSLNRFGYSFGRPTALIDPTGLDPTTTVDSILELLQQIGQALKPDYVRLQFGLDFPLFGPVRGVVVDRYGKLYLQPLGLTFGSPGPFASVTVGWLVQPQVPSEDDLTSFLTGPSYTGGGSFGAAVDLIWSPLARGTQYAVESGIGSLRAGFSGGESFLAGKVLPGW